MVFFNYSTMQMAAKVVYYGPGLGGKTTNLQHIYGHTTSDSRGEMVSLETETDRTLFFDLLPIDVGQIGGFNTRIQLYTVPGQVFYNTTRKLVLKGVDGVVFIADSQRPMLQANLESFRNLEENLTEMGLSLEELPIVLQYNKRDLPEVLSVDELNQTLNRGGWPWVEASALKGNGVFETLKAISKLTLITLKRRLAKGAESSRPAPRPVPPRPAAAIPAAAAAAATAAAAAAASTPPSASGPVPIALPGPAPVPAAAAPAPAPPRPAPTTAPAPAAAPRPAAAAAAPPVAAAPKVRKGEIDVLGELERIRKQALRPLAAPAPAAAAAAATAPAAPAKPAAPPAPAAAPPPAAAPRPTAPVAAPPRPAAPVAPAQAPPAPAARAAAPAGPPAAAPLAPRPAAPAPPPTAPAATPAAAAAAPAGGNGLREITREVQLLLKRDDFQRARRFRLSVQVEDAEHRIVDGVRDLHVDVHDLASLGKLLLHLDIAVATKD